MLEWQSTDWQIMYGIIQGYSLGVCAVDFDSKFNYSHMNSNCNILPNV